MGSIFKYSFFCFFLLVLTSCQNEGTTELGIIKVPNSNNISLRVFYEWENFERKYPHFYQILKDDKVISKPIFIFGVLDSPDCEISDFSVLYKNEIIYLFNYSREEYIVAIYDLKTGEGFPHSKPNEKWNKIYPRRDKLMKMIE